MCFFVTFTTLETTRRVGETAQDLIKFSSKTGF
jgi:hypothetical protein